MRVASQRTKARSQCELADKGNVYVCQKHDRKENSTIVRLVTVLVFKTKRNFVGHLRSIGSHDYGGEQRSLSERTV